MFEIWWNHGCVHISTECFPKSSLQKFCQKLGTRLNKQIGGGGGDRSSSKPLTSGHSAVKHNMLPCGLHHLFQNRLFKNGDPHHIRVCKVNFILQELDHTEVLPNLYEVLWLFNIFKSKMLLDPYTYI